MILAFYVQTIQNKRWRNKERIRRNKERNNGQLWTAVH
jgi:hypothetical protein